MSSKKNFSESATYWYALDLYELSKENSELDKIENQSKNMLDLLKNSLDFQFAVKDLTIKKNFDSFIAFGLKKFRKIDSVVCCSYPKSKGWGEIFENLKENSLKEDLHKQLGGTIIFCQRIIKYFLKSKKLFYCLTFICWLTPT